MKFLLFAVLAMLLGACRVFDDGSSDTPSGTYAYTAYDAAGKTAVVGELRIDAKRGERIRTFVLEGTWESRHAGAPRSDVGPQVGTGSLSGFVDRDGTYWIDLNPEIADNNVALLGAFENREYQILEGIWQHVTLSGPAAQGSYEAERKPKAD